MDQFAFFSMLTFADQLGCKQLRICSAFCCTEATSEHWPPASQERLTSILVSDSREIGQTEVDRHNPRPILQGSEPNGRWPTSRPWAVRGAIGVPTQPGGFLPWPVRTPPFCLQEDREFWRAEP